MTSEQVAKLYYEAKRIVDLIVEVGHETNWRDGVDTDRVYSWEELAPLWAAVYPDAPMQKLGDPAQ